MNIGRNIRIRLTWRSKNSRREVLIEYHLEGIHLKHNYVLLWFTVQTLLFGKGYQLLMMILFLKYLTFFEFSGNHFYPIIDNRLPV